MANVKDKLSLEKKPTKNGLDSSSDSLIHMHKHHKESAKHHEKMMKQIEGKMSKHHAKKK